MFDAAYPPDYATARTLRASTGASVFAVYVPGWGAPYRGATPAEVKALVAAGYQILPILVPDGVAPPVSVAEAAVGITKAREFMGECGLTCPTVAVDIESNWSSGNLGDAVWTFQSFQDAAKRQGVLLVQYGSPAFLNALPRPLEAACWVASWAGVDWPPDGVGAPGLMNDGDWKQGIGWQWSGATTLLGASVDRSVIPDTWDLSVVKPPGDPSPAPTPAPTPTTSPANPSTSPTQSEIEQAVSLAKSLLAYLESLLA